MATSFISVPTQALLDRFDDLYGDNGHVYLAYLNSWDETTLLNIVMTDLDRYYRRSKPDLSLDQLIWLCFGCQHPSRRNLLDYIVEMTQAELIIGVPNRPIGSLMGGIFYRSDRSNGNLYLISDLDLQRLLDHLGLPKTQVRIDAELAIIEYQNGLLETLRSRGCSYYCNGWSVDDVIFQG